MNGSLSEEQRQEIRAYMLEKYGYAIETLNDAVCSMLFENDTLALDCFVKHMKKILLIANQAIALENGNALDELVV